MADGVTLLENEATPDAEGDGSGEAEPLGEPEDVRDAEDRGVPLPDKVPAHVPVALEDRDALTVTEGVTVKFAEGEGDLDAVAVDDVVPETLALPQKDAERDGDSVGDVVGD